MARKVRHFSEEHRQALAEAAKRRYADQHARKREQVIPVLVLSDAVVMPRRSFKAVKSVLKYAGFRIEAVRATLEQDKQFKMLIDGLSSALAGL